ncbi:hypothetical protein POKO110462_06955 [Pontibacter korlensis]|uniref:Uncharacterized protein n=1 Tax=Pontibacter korlensis TaxID=400092 RepID=A0A0E3UYJ7_9BACT|nr:hypothetical protein [Pontibacter korlensis]AKD04511.1 hypothetical protein PKOR_17190 [Pontibacter korlensis]
MFKSAIVALVLRLAALQGYGQTESIVHGPEPIEGIGKVALPFYKINFSKEQKELLQQKEIELIFFIDVDGTPTLEDVNGIDDAAIQDSLQHAATKVTMFYPRTVNSLKESSLYFLQFQLPKYETEQASMQRQSIFKLEYKQPAYDDFEYIHKSGQRLDVAFGIAANAFLGKAGEYLHPGGGMKVDLMYTGKKGVGGGLVMSFYGNEQKKDYPINSGREQTHTPPTLIVGLAANKAFAAKERTEFNAQVELAYAVQKVTPKLEHEDDDWVQLKGFSPGFVINYLIKLSKDKPGFFYGMPSITNHYLNVHAAVRPVIFNLKEACGVMLELGISYRLGSHLIDEYRLKQ